MTNWIRPTSEDFKLATRMEHGFYSAMKKLHITAGYGKQSSCPYANSTASDIIHALLKAKKIELLRLGYVR